VESPIEELREALRGVLPELFGMELLEAEHGLIRGRLRLRPQLMAANGFVHAGTVITLADTCCGAGCRASLPEGATSFTTIELKSNFVRSAGPEDTLACEAVMSHGGAVTQVWDAGVTRESDGKALALFRCTQYVLR
jgi:1,4-dihydroxy-2-naphthoyl-CoA hydrolase